MLQSYVTAKRFFFVAARYDVARRPLVIIIAMQRTRCN